MPKPLTPSELVERLERRSVDSANEIRRRLKRAQKAVAVRIEALSERQAAAGSKQARDKLFARITNIYDVTAAEIDAWMKDQVEKTAVEWHTQAVKDMRTLSGDKVLVKFSRDLVQRYWELVHGGNAEFLAAVFTQEMAAKDIRHLRSAFLDTFRQQTLEAWTAKETQKALQSRWDQLARNLRADRFVDATGRPWTNAHYLNMLTRTTFAKVERESYCDALIAEGHHLARIADDGDPCPVCRAWAGVIVDISGKQRSHYPSLKQAYDAGWGHPNCQCRPEYLDPHLDKDEIDRQRKQSAANWSDPKSVQNYNDEIRLQAKRDGGMSAEEAERDLKRDKLKRELLAGGFEGFEGAVDGIPAAVLDQMDRTGIPRIERAKKGDQPNSSRNSSLGGVLHLDPKAGKDDFLGAFMGLQEKRGVAVAVPKAGADSAIQAYQKATSSAGFSEAVIDRIANLPDSVVNKLPELPKMVVSKSKAFYQPGANEIHMPTDAKTWSGHPLTFDHEVGHALHTKTGAIVGGLIDDDLRSAIETDYAAWKKTAKEKHGKAWSSHYARGSSGFANELAQRLGAESYFKATPEQQHRVTGMLDALGGMSKGRYGEGHSVAYYQGSGGVHGYKEVYANAYRSLVNQWSEYGEIMPLTSSWIRRSIGL